MKSNATVPEIEAIIKALKKDYNLTLRDIEKGLGYSEDYISDAMSKGGNPTLLKKIKKYQVQVEERAKNPAYEVLDIVRELRVKVDIIFSEMVALIADQKKQSQTVTREQFQKMVDEKLKNK